MENYQREYDRGGRITTTIPATIAITMTQSTPEQFGNTLHHAHLREGMERVPRNTCEKRKK